MTVLVVGVFLLLALSDFPQLIQARKWYDAAVLAALYLFVLTMAVMQTLQMTVPSPVKAAQFLISQILGIRYPDPT